MCIFEVIDISPGNLDSSLCFMWLGAPNLNVRCCKCYILLYDQSVYHYIMPSFVFLTDFCLQYWYPSFLCFYLHGDFFPILHFQSLCFFRSKVSFLGVADRWVFFSNPFSHLCLLIGTFSSFTFKVIIDRYTYCHLVKCFCFFFSQFFSVFIFFLLSLHFWCDSFLYSNFSLFFVYLL